MSGRSILPTIAPPAWPPQPQSSSWPVSPTVVDGWSQGHPANQTVVGYFAIASIRTMFTFAGILFLSPFVESLPQTANIIALVLLAAELLTAYRSLKARNVEANRAWTVANLACFVGVFVWLLVSSVAPASLEPWPPGADRRGEPAPLVSRIPTIWALLSTIAAGFTLPAVRVQNWRSGLGVDKFPSLDSPVYSPASTAVALGLNGSVDGPAALQQTYSGTSDSGPAR